MFLRLIHVAYRFYWFVFCCVRIYVPFLLLTGVCFQYFAETASDTVAIPGARVCSLSGRTPGRRTGSWGVRAFSLTKWSYTRSFPGWFPQFTVQVTICPIHILWTAVLSDLSFFFFFFLDLSYSTLNRHSVVQILLSHALWNQRKYTWPALAVFAFSLWSEAESAVSQRGTCILWTLSTYSVMKRITQ